MTPSRNEATAPAGAADRDAFVAELFAWLEEAGASRYDEQVTQLEHALQTAAIVAQSGAAPTLIAAALLHDVGHLLAREHAGNADFLAVDREHEQVGADWLGRFFPAAVAEPVRLHVPAKRYLCAIDPTYRRGLSLASERSLIVQGGPMPDEEAARFAASPGAEDAVRLRRADDQGKVLGRMSPPLETYAGLLHSLLR
jgi:phosphonate degradation associated HDIG domain protein